MLHSMPCPTRPNPSLSACQLAHVTVLVRTDMCSKWCAFRAPWCPSKLLVPVSVCDVTKEYGNHGKNAARQGGPWSLRDSPAAQRLRAEAAHRKRQRMPGDKNPRILEVSRQALQRGLV